MNKKTSNRLPPGFSFDREGALHLDIPTLLKMEGWPDTLENRALMTEAAKKVLAEVWPQAQIIET